jgi:hypothetical protein
MCPEVGIVLSLQIREHCRAIFDSGNGQNTAACPLGIHQIGRCTCDSFLVAEESSARASVSRIVMLTEALFEVCPFPSSFEMNIFMYCKPFSSKVLNLFLSSLIHWIIISILIVFVEEPNETSECVCFDNSMCRNYQILLRFLGEKTLLEFYSSS